MRVLVVQPGPNFSVQDVSDGWVRGLRQVGATVVELNYAARLQFYEEAHRHRDGECVEMVDTDGAILLASKGIEAACYEVWPDLVVFISGFYVPPAVYELLRIRGHRVVLVHTESPYEDDRQLERAPLVDLNVVNDPTNLDRYPPGTIYLPHAYDPEIHTPDGPAGPPSDVAIVGTGYPSRIEFLEQVDWTGLDVYLGGNWQWLADDSPLRDRVGHPIAHCLPNREAVQVYRAARSSLNLYRREISDGGTAEGWSMGPREVELAATGTFYLTEARGENREVLPMVPTVTGPDDYSEQVRWWLAHPDECKQVVAAARDAISGRTFANHARQLLGSVFG